MRATGRSIVDAGRRARIALLAAFVGAAAWAQSDKPLDLRIPKTEAPPTAGATCPTCGEIRSIREVNVGRTQALRSANLAEQTGSQSPVNDEGRLVGAVIYLPLGGGTKSDEGWRFGAAGTPEMQARLNDNSYEITVLMDSGERRTIQRRDGSRFQVGQRVTLRSGELEPMYP
jgi:outer membrane lipoprotein SlyB